MYLLFSICRVIAYNAMGESKPSEESDVCSSNEAPPEHHPRRVHTDRSKPGVLIIKWDVSTYDIIDLMHPESMY